MTLTDYDIEWLLDNSALQPIHDLRGALAPEPGREIYEVAPALAREVLACHRSLAEIRLLVARCDYIPRLVQVAEIAARHGHEIKVTLETTQEAA